MVQIFVPCFIDQLFPQTAVNMVKLLQKAGCEVEYNPKQTCCGQPAFNAGYWEEANVVAEKFVHDLSQIKAPIICPSSSCVGYVRSFMQDLTFASPVSNKAFENIRGSIFELSEYLVDVLGVVDFGAKLDAKVTYHDACAALRECNIKSAPRKLLENVAGLELVEMPETDQCCGFGGTFAVKFEPISVAMTEKKVENALSVGAEYLISADLSCLMQMDGYIQKKKLPLKVMHLADLLMCQG
jgi:L-lactate dehydrogenase complex protein LldE